MRMCELTFPGPITSAPHRYTPNPLRLEDRNPALGVPCLDVFGIAAGAGHLAISAGGGVFGSDLEEIPDPDGVRWKKGAELALNDFSPAIGEVLYHGWPCIRSRLNLQVEVPLSGTEVLQKPVGRSGV